MNDFFKQIRIVLFEKTIDFSGRASRKEYWSFWLFTQLTSLILLIMSLRAKPLVIFFIIYILILLIPSMAVTVRRLHDVNKSALWLIGFGPFVLIAYMSIFLLSLISPGNQTSVQMDIFQIFLILTYVFGIVATALWYCFPIFMFLVQEGNQEENRFGSNK
ncbi:MAG: DUF805 domain-containing protein [Chloroflexota bacterium]|nr:DUF805 domain-containing protein [Chloroflexota bacterium]